MNKSDMFVFDGHYFRSEADSSVLSNHSAFSDSFFYNNPWKTWQDAFPDIRCAHKLQFIAGKERPNSHKLIRAAWWADGKVVFGGNLCAYVRGGWPFNWFENIILYRASNNRYISMKVWEPYFPGEKSPMIPGGIK